jgi:hypothetical protein
MSQTRITARCKTCKKHFSYLCSRTWVRNGVQTALWAADVDGQQAYAGALDLPSLDVKCCGARVRLVPVVRSKRALQPGFVPHECSHACTHALNGVCDCECGGRNHGMHVRGLIFSVES